MNTNKNIPEIIEAVSKLKEGNKNIKFFSINAVSSNNIHSSGIYKHCKEIVKDNRLENNVYFFTKFLKEEEVEILLQISDLIVFNYSDVGESASASVRKALASKNPIIVTDINMFSEFKDEIFKIKDTSAQSVYEGIKKVMASNDLTKSLVEKGEEFIDNNLYERKSLQMLKAYSE